jgi:hypothetical protein
VIVIGGIAYAVDRWHKSTFVKSQEALTPGLVPVFASSDASTGEPVVAQEAGDDPGRRRENHTPRD